MKSHALNDIPEKDLGDIMTELERLNRNILNHPRLAEQAKAEMAMKQKTHNQGKCVVERCGECDSCQEWMMESTQAKRGLPCTNLLVMFPDGTVRNCGSKRKTEKAVKQWFTAHMNDDRFNVGIIEWRQYTGTMDAK